nr:hypothetical protein [uncultured bacterium]
MPLPSDFASAFTCRLLPAACCLLPRLREARKAGQNNVEGTTWWYFSAKS